jgi:hypothetical protein
MTAALAGEGMALAVFGAQVAFAILLVALLMFAIAIVIALIVKSLHCMAYRVGCSQESLSVTATAKQVWAAGKQTVTLVGGGKSRDKWSGCKDPSDQIRKLAKKFGVDRSKVSKNFHDLKSDDLRKAPDHYYCIDDNGDLWNKRTGERVGNVITGY